MLRFDQGNARFNFRSVAVIIHEGYVLIHRGIEDTFWALPGGRVEFFEHSDATLTRELLEELGANSVIKRHLWYVESFFEFGDKKYHEIGNYFLVEFEDPNQFPKNRTFRGLEADVDLEFMWFPLSQLSSIHLEPTFLQKGLLNLPLHTTYIKDNEINTVPLQT